MMTKTTVQLGGIFSNLYAIRLWQIVVGFAVLYVLSLLNFEGLHHLTFSLNVVGMLVVGFLVGKKEKSPFFMVICYHLIIFIGVGLTCILDNPGIFPNIFPLFQLASGMAMYVGILIRQHRMPSPAAIALVVSLLVCSASLSFYALPVSFFYKKDFPLSTSAAGLELIGLNTDNLRLPAAGKKVVVLDFWNTVCLSCFESKHELIALSDQWKNDARVLIASVASAKYDSLTDVQSSDYLTLPGSERLKEYFDPSGRLAQIIAPTGCPVIGFIDASGQVVLRHAGYEKATRGVYTRLLDKRIREMLERPL
jgi:thiol-disulfide isomerase/thioredoxin